LGEENGGVEIKTGGRKGMKKGIEDVVLWSVSGMMSGARMFSV
jgi:hypothetical protein